MPNEDVTVEYINPIEPEPVQPVEPAEVEVEADEEERHPTADERVCHACGHIGLVDDMLCYEGNSYWYCEDCTSRCQGCEDTFPTSEVNDFRGVGNLCESCAEHYYRCADCGDYVHEESTYSVSDGDRSVCRSCYEEHYFCCHGCGETISNDDSHEYDDSNYCQSCYDDLDRDDDEEAEPARATPPPPPAASVGPAMQIYPAKGHPRFVPCLTAAETLAPPPLPPLFGYELEFIPKPAPAASRRSEGAVTEAKALTVVHPEINYIQRDSSCWLELTSQPFSHAFWVEKGRAELMVATSKLNEMGCRSWDGERCGLHLHVSRRTVGKWGICRLFHFCLQNEMELYSVSGRTKGAWERWCRPIPKDKNDEQLLEGGWSRYSILNVEPTETIELRFIRGTFKNPERSVALAMCLFRYIMSVPESAVFYADWEPFVNWCRIQATDHSDVVAMDAYLLMEKRGVLRELSRAHESDEGNDA